MKKMTRFACILLCLLLLLCACSEKEEGKVEVLKPSEQLYVTDDAGILSDETEQYVVSRVGALKQLCGGEIAVATIDFLPYGLNSEEYAYELINQWGVGDKEKNNGVVLLLVPGEAKGWITAGLGIEQSLTAGRLDSILNLHLWTDFDNGEYQWVAELTDMLGMEIKSGNINALVKKGNVEKSGEREVIVQAKRKVGEYSFVKAIG